MVKVIVICSRLNSLKNNLLKDCSLLDIYVLVLEFTLEIEHI